MKREANDYRRCRYNKGLLNYPVEKWHGGKVHRINESVIHLMRGQVYEICGKTFFTFGGARSQDIWDGILDPASFEDRREYKAVYRDWYDRNLVFRIKNVSWWEEELCSQEEQLEAMQNLEKHGWKVDYIVTHCASNEIQALYSGGQFKTDRQTDFLQMIKEKTDYEKWFFGHYHDNRNVTPKDLLIYEQIIRIA